MHRHVEWDDPGAASVMRHYEKNPIGYSDPGPGDILSARYQGLVVRIRVDAYVDGTSIGEVVALINPASGERRKLAGKLAQGDIVRLPDASRAFEPTGGDEDEGDEDHT
ncbi:hypothetical protein KZO25_16510 [Halomonas sp. ANAO-440]|uniref:Uncharacterized protein n=2 Tax=Halomonas chromatireducens TaxID=507626 RepID=A0A109UKL1_9GAMM|nr:MULTISPECIES: hypothetical protein [Halomonas]AMC99122.1 hypothetical protein LOKO_00018 [Halomonas chromatireducens]MBZ0331921.1 hypothetical protein [Halomonas sp. ANAO-440]